MKEFKNKVAVITGAASGIGRGVAKHCAQEGMQVVLADVEQEALRRAEQELRSTGATVLAVPTDVSKAGEVKALAQKTLDTYGGVHLLFNNAGVSGGNTIWESTLADWEWVLGVNLWGVIHGLRVFVPIMLAQDVECHIVNTASIAGLLSYHPTATYQVTKHAVVALSEQLYFSLALRAAKVKTSVLCPGWVNTQIMDSERNRPVALRNPDPDQLLNPVYEAMLQYGRQAVQAGMSPSTVAEQIFSAIREDKFYILTHPEFRPNIQERMQNILKEHNPTWTNTKT
jgi:NAD(P)-dependent dehydrogenase (short-subunit alcohol dehydrogenase family)